jgi:hypothetical protein
LRRGITPSCQSATSVHLAVVTIARCVDTIATRGAAPCGLRVPVRRYLDSRRARLRFAQPREDQRRSSPLTDLVAAH